MIEKILHQIRFLNRLVELNDVNCHDVLRMDRETFHRFCHLLKSMVGLSDGKYVTVPEMVASFMLAVGHHSKNRVFTIFWRGQKGFDMTWCSITPFFSELVKRISQGRIDVIELFVEQMHQEKIQPDTSTCTHVFLAYVENGLETTMEALQVLSMRMISEQDYILEETRLKYESLILSEDLKAESPIIDVFRERPTLAVALLLLRWCATLGFPLNWLPRQSPWSKRLSSDYSSRRGNLLIRESTGFA